MNDLLAGIQLERTIFNWVDTKLRNEFLDELEMSKLEEEDEEIEETEIDEDLSILT